MTVRGLLREGNDKLFYAEVDTPYLDAVLLLSHAMGTRKESLLASMPDEVEADAAERFLLFLDRRCRGEPVSYIRRCKEFYGLDFYVDERVLVPRPDTEVLVEKALDLARHDARIRDVHDACTGSGCVCIALQHDAPHLNLSASDVSPPAAEVFRGNALRLLGREIPFQLSDLLDGVTGPFHLITANPPYLSDKEVDDMRRIGWPEPEISLRGGADGTVLPGKLIRRAAERLVPGGWLALEAAPGQFLKLRALMDAAGFRDVEVLPDLAGRDRVISGRLA
jgi:release factor glutamine methyltransferase